MYWDLKVGIFEIETENPSIDLKGLPNVPWSVHFELWNEKEVVQSTQIDDWPPVAVGFGHNRETGVKPRGLSVVNNLYSSFF